MNVALVAGLLALFPNLSLFPSTDEPAGDGGARETARVVAERTGALPAEQVLAAVFANDPTTLPGGGWRAASDPGGAVGTPFDFACGTPKGPAPAFVELRGWAQTNGPLPQNLQAAVTVSMRAYGAGGGAAAFDALKDSISDCSGANRSTRTGLGVEAMSARNSQSSALIWRRGDVLGVVTYQADGRAGDLAAVAPLAGDYDQRLATALIGPCITVDSTLTDAGRSPYIDRTAFTGRTVPYEVRLDAQAQQEIETAAAAAAATSPTPTAPTTTSAPRTGSPRSTSPAEAALVVVPVPVPSPEITLPTLDTLPKKPAGTGVLPEALPTEVDRPTAPTAPTQGALSVDVPRQVADPDGPGCGWDFTGQTAPPFDADSAKRALKTAEDAAQQQLQTDWQRWIRDRDAYYVAYAQYKQQADQYLAYVAEVEKTRTAWAIIDAAQAGYTTALAAYEAAVEARDEFLADQAEARTAYETAVESCQTRAPATGTPTPPATTTPSRPTGTPTPTGTPSPTTPPAVCPPVRPAILDQQAPPVPVRPTPPAGVPAPN